LRRECVFRELARIDGNIPLGSLISKWHGNRSALCYEVLGVFTQVNSILRLGARIPRLV
jgi:hypothetical protein